uniref:CHAT domain-containing protein n=1 Tax=Bionectria ochroleuca TaxID=29856 RepID=A0A8H7N5G1_BIOOC
MDAVVVIRTRSQSPRTAHQHQHQGSVSANGTNNNHAAAQPAANGATHRSWMLSVTINNRSPHEFELNDPFTEDEYKSILEPYLRHSEKPSLLLTAEDEAAPLDVQGAELKIDDYTENLFAQLDKKLELRNSGVAKYHIFVVEDHSSRRPSENAHGIQCLAWELLESMDKPCMRTTRVANFVPGGSGGTPQSRVPQELSSVRSGYLVKVLLVVARDFTLSGADRDPEPDLAQYPLMTVQKKLRTKGKGRMLLEVVRPGSREELEQHLRTRSRQDVFFHIVHFDLHGIVQEDEHGRMVPWLLFAKKHDETVGQPYNLPGTCLAKADSIAEVLARYKVENVVLNSCLSAYNRHESGTNLAQTFLRHGISNVSAMWYYVHWQTVSTYLETFYNDLLVNQADFHVAAHKGRDSIRRKYADKTGRRYKDFFICVNYTREARHIIHASRDRSPSLSDQSQDSSNSSSSRVKWKPPAVLLGDNLMAPMDEPIRMKLHLLELEYKLTTFRVVYASDLQRSDAKMETTIDQMITMWLATNLVDEVYFYRAKDLDKPNMMLDGLPYREKRTRLHGSRYLPSSMVRESVRSLRQKLLVIRGIDDVLDPGTQAYPEDNQRNEKRRRNVEDTLARLTDRLHKEQNSYLLFIGGKDAQWWRGHLEHLDGQWWLHMPWNITVHSRYNRDIMVPGDGGRRSLTPSPLGRSRW